MFYSAFSTAFVHFQSSKLMKTSSRILIRYKNLVSFSQVLLAKSLCCIVLPVV